MNKKYKKNKYQNLNQRSFYFEDYLNKEKKSEKNKNNYHDRIYLLFFSFFSLILIFSIKITLVSLKSPETYRFKENLNQFTILRRDIVDRNGTLISRNVKSFHAAVKPQLIKNKENFLIKLRLNFPNLDIKKVKKKLNKGKYFYLQRGLDQIEKEKLWSLGEKGIIFEPFQSRIYTHANLYSHIIGQIDYDNYGISGVEKYFDKQLKNKDLLNEPLQLTLDTNIQHIIYQELNLALKTFNATGGAALLMDSKNGEILSLISLPDFDINKRASITDKNFINKISKGVYELGSIFKTFTVALALEKELASPETIIENIPQKIKCSIHEIADIKKHPQDLSVSEILVRSSNVGSTILAKKIGKDEYKKFFKKTNLLGFSELELEELGEPFPLKWNNKCTLETVSYGHGVSVTPLQATSTYASLTNGGILVKPTILKKNIYLKNSQVISKKTSDQLNRILRKVVSGENGTASLADIHGYSVGGKTGTSENYKNKKDNINTFISVFPSFEPKYAFLIMLENPKPAPNLIYEYRGKKIKVNRNESGWNSVYVAGKIIEKIGPILAINNEEFYDKHVVKKIN